MNPSTAPSSRWHGARTVALNDPLRLRARTPGRTEEGTLVAAIREREDRRDTVRESLAGLERLTRQTPADVEREIRERLEDWRAMLRRTCRKAARCYESS